MSAQSVSRFGDESSSAVQPATVASLSGLAVVAASTVLMLQSMRVFVSYLVFVVDQSNRTMLGGIAVGVFLASGLALLLIRATSIRAVIAASVVLLAASRLALQYWELPEARLWLGAAAIVGWGWLAFSILITRRELIALGIGLGLALDLGIRVAFRTVDTPWMPGFSAYLVTWALVAALVAALFQFELPHTAHSLKLSGSISLLAIGPTFAVYHLMTGNLGLVQSHLRIDFPGAAVLLTFGMALGILGAAFRCSGEIAILMNMRWWLAWRAALVVAAIGGFWWFWSGPTLRSIGIMLGTASSIILFAELMLDGNDRPGTTRLTRAAVFFTVGLLAEVGLLFAYYTYSGSPTFIAVAVGLFLVVAVIGTPRAIPHAWERGFPIVVAVGIIGGLLLLISGWQVWSWNDAAATSAIGPDITIMTYNIQNGFSANKRFDLEQTAEVIEAQKPDIVVLQEVSRGWLVTSGVDEVLWLSHRLNMNYAFGANSDDGMWGNVVLSRAPIGSVRKVQYNVTENLKRSVLEVQVATRSGGLWVLATHLDDPRDAGAVRLQQADELIAAWNHEAPTVLLGDMNSDPNDPVISTFEAAGLTDFGRLLPPSAYTSHDGRRIDYIFGTDDIMLDGIRVPDVWTSDHRPVVAQISILPAQAKAPGPTTIFVPVSPS
jgi:endonuclease/exonuclease/phosphatase family metal-dependent hydrolase